MLDHSVVQAVVFDVDFTLARPGPDMGPSGYRELGLRYGLALDPDRHDQARSAAFAELELHPEMDHDDEIWVLFTERIIQGMGGVGDTYAAAVEMERRWSEPRYFELYADARPVVETLVSSGVKIGLLSNSARDLQQFIAYHRLWADALLTSSAHGKTKPHATIFRAILELLDVAPGEALMVGDMLHDDIEGARAAGMQALLLDREERYPDLPERIPDLRALLRRLGLG